MARVPRDMGRGEGSGRWGRLAGSGSGSRGWAKAVAPACPRNQINQKPFLGKLVFIGTLIPKWALGRDGVGKVLWSGVGRAGSPRMGGGGLVPEDGCREVVPETSMLQGGVLRLEVPLVSERVSHSSESCVIFLVSDGAFAVVCFPKPDTTLISQLVG